VGQCGHGWPGVGSLCTWPLVAFEALDRPPPVPGRDDDGLRRSALPQPRCRRSAQLSPGARPDVSARARQAPRGPRGTALELAAALRAALRIGTTRSDMPRLARDVREAWLAEAPQPLAESIAELGGAHNAYQARDIAKGLILTLVRYLLAMVLAMTAQRRAASADLALRELLRALDQRLLSIDSRIRFAPPARAPAGRLRRHPPRGRSCSRC